MSGPGTSTNVVTKPRVGHVVRVLSARIRLAVVVVVIAACRNPTPHAHGDASVTPLLPGEATALAETFLEGREARGVESCRCAGDVPFCETETIPPINVEARTCLEAALETGGAGFRTAIPCLDDAVHTFVACATPYACAEVAARTACRDAYETTGSACFSADPALSGLLAACLPESD